MSDRLRHDLADLSQEVQIVDLTQRARSTSRRMGIRRAAVAGIATVLLVVVGTVAFLRFGPDRSGPPTNPNPTVSTLPQTPEPSGTRSLYSFPAPPATATKLGPWTSVPAGAFPGQVIFFAGTAGTNYSVKVLANATLRTSSLGRLDEDTSCVLQSITASPDGRQVAWIRGTITTEENQLVITDLSSLRASAVADHVTCGGPVWQADSWSIDTNQFREPVTIALDSGRASSLPVKLNGHHEYVPGLVAYKDDGHIVVENASGVLHRVPYDGWSVGFSVQDLSYDGRHVGVNYQNTDPGRVVTVSRVVDMTTGKEITLPVPSGQTLVTLRYLPDGGMVMQTSTRLIRFDRNNAVVAQVTLPAGTGTLMRYVA